jgi:hypothetical protein
LLVGSLVDAALLLDRLTTEGLLQKDLLTAMLDGKSLGGPIADRPWLCPRYGLGVMVGNVTGGLSIVGHTGGGPGSCIAVYRDISSGIRSCCATFQYDSDAGALEKDAVSKLTQLASAA